MAGLLGLNVFYAASINGSKTNANPIELAQEIIENISAETCTFSILHVCQGIRYAYGYIYNNKKYGYITIEQYSGFHVSYNINDGVYVQVTS